MITTSCQHGIAIDKACNECSILTLLDGTGQCMENIVDRTDLLALMKGWSLSEMRLVAPFAAVNSLYLSDVRSRIERSADGGTTCVVVPRLRGDIRVYLAQSGEPNDRMRIEIHGETVGEIRLG